MGSHDQRESTMEERPSEKKHREKKERDPNRPHRSRPKIYDPETGEVIKSPHRRRKRSEREKEKEKDMRSESGSSMTNLVPELSRTASAPGASSRSSLPYPSFNKSFSREAVNSREDVKPPAKRETSPYTPESTDIGVKERLRSKSTEQFGTSKTDMNKDTRPPSPPDTEFSQQHRKSTPNRMAQVQEDEETEARPNSRTSFFSQTSKTERDEDRKSKLSVNSKHSKASTIKSPKVNIDNIDNGSSEDNRIRDSGIGSGIDSNVTSVAPKKESGTDSKQRPPALDTDSSPGSVQDSSPRTPTQTPSFVPPSIKPTPSPFINYGAPTESSVAYDSPMPPPPPPPPNVPVNIPCVDYLMQNGGLLRPAPKALVASPPIFAPHQSSSRAPTPLPSEIERIFGPYFSVLDQYETVINKNGSLAVATGYRSVARRLLDRLEMVFNRDLSSEGCVCVMCQDPNLSEEGSKGLGWGEVLEWVSGRRELPVWPAFDFATLGVRAPEAFSKGDLDPNEPPRPASPTKIDPDIPDDFHAQFLQQSKKTKVAINRWLSSCPQTAATPPQEVDDETLSFAILTHLEPEARPVFNAMIKGSNVLQPLSRAPTPMLRNRSEFMLKTVHSLQRLYRLPIPPRDPEAAIYLLKHPDLHNLLATMSSINQSEWEMLTSGRFDGFLWSGNEPDFGASPGPSRGPTPANGIPLRGAMSPLNGMRQPGGSRTTTPFMRNQTFSPAMNFNGFPPSRGPTPFAPVRQPISNDEETEIAVLAEIEREIYVGMEALEDAFEGLHRKAETVRRALRERGAGLSMSLQSRRSGLPDILCGTPALPPGGMGPGYERPAWAEGSDIHSESDWDPRDDASELAPDDSASNISSSRHRRPKRRNERRTPAPVEEEDED